jgi:hypothetical protein
MKQKIFLFVGLFLMMSAVGQKASKIKFHSMANAGLVTGKTDNTLQLQTINGIEFKTYSACIGIGLDDYYFKTIPLFVDLRKNLSEKKSTPFVYLDLGASIPWDRAKIETWTSSYYKTGFLYDMGIGYSVPIKGKFAFNFSAGYSEKILNETRETSSWIWIDYMPGPAPSSYKDTADYRYTLRRISLKIGLSF